MVSMKSIYLSRFLLKEEEKNFLLSGGSGRIKFYQAYRSSKYGRF